MAAPTILVQKVGGSTFPTSTTPGSTDCNLGPIVIQANKPITTTLTVPATATSLMGELLSADLEVDVSAVMEVTIGGNLLPRFVLSGARAVTVSPGTAPNAVEFTLSDKRYEVSRRYVGRTGFPANATPAFYDASTLPAGWTINPGAPDTVTVTHLGTPDALGGTRGMVVNASGPGPGNSISAGVNLSTESFDRRIGFGAYVFAPSGSYAPNAEGLAITLHSYDTGSGLVKEVATAAVQVLDTWQIMIGSVAVPAGETYSIELRLHAADGDLYFQEPGTLLTESLAWESTDVSDILIDLVTHASDTTNWGHSDCALTADSTSIPSTGIELSRSIASATKQAVSSAIEEMTNVARLWQYVVPGVSTDKLWATTGGGSPGISASSSNSNLGEWEWAGDNHAGMLGVFAPDNIDPAGSRLVMGIGSGGVLATFGTAWDLGREQYMAGPYGDYDPRVVSNLLVPFYAQKQAALTVPITFGYDSSIVAAVTSQALKPGCLLPANVGTWPVGVNDTFRVVNVKLDTKNWQVQVDVNRDL